MSASSPPRKTGKSIPSIKFQSKESLNITFNQSAVGSEAGVGVELNTAQFRLNTSIKPVPTVEFHPNRTVPILEDFHKVKYIIKAF